MMQWRESLSALKQELERVRPVRQREAAEAEEKLSRERQSLANLAESLGISSLLSDINSRILDGQGELESIVSWEPDEDGDGDGEDGLDALDVFDDDDGDQYDAITHALSWEEFGDREIEVELVLSEDGASILVNGVEVRPEREALEMALLEAIRDELEL